MILQYEQGRLPEGWIITTLENISEITMGRSPPSSTYNKEKTGMPFYQGKADFGDMHPTARIWCDKPQTFAQKHDILMSVRAPVGSTNISMETCSIGRGLAAIRALETIATMYLFYQLRHLENKISQQGTGTTFKAVTKNQVTAISISVPPFNEQKRIVAKIESIFAQIDAAKERLEALQAKVQSGSASLATLKSSVLKQAFEGTITTKWQKENKDKLKLANQSLKEFLLYLNKKNKISYGIIYKDNLSYLSYGWYWVKLGYIAKVGQGGTPSTRNSQFWNGDIPWLRSGEVKNNFISSAKTCITKQGLTHSSTTLCPKGSVLLAMTGQGLTRGRSAILELNACTNQSIAYIIPSNTYLFNKFLFYYFRHQYWKIRSISKGSNQAGLNVSMIKQFEIPIPTIREQKIVVQKIESIFAKIDATDKLVRDSLIRLGLLRKSVLKKAFEGRLVPQDPRDESAEMLLQRINRERTKEQ